MSPPFCSSMHILLLPSWYPSSADDVRGVFFRDQAVALRDHGHRVGVIAPFPLAARELAERGRRAMRVQRDPEEAVPTFRRGYPGFPQRVPQLQHRFFTRAAKDLLRAYVEEHGAPDLIHAHVALHGGVAGVDLAKRLGIPLVLTEHSTGFARSAYNRWQLRLAARALKEATLRIAVSPSLVEQLERTFPETAGLWTCIQNVVANRFTSAPRSSVTKPSVRFLNLGLMTEKKGQQDLLEAFSLLTADGFRAELWLAGDGPDRVALEQSARDLGLVEQVRFLGMIAPDGVPRLFSEIDVVVVASHYETFGLAAAEALMAGVPVIATRCGGPEHIVDAEDGLIVQVRDPSALAHAMRQIGENLSAYDSERLMARARARFSADAIATRLTEAYEMATARHSLSSGH